MVKKAAAGSRKYSFVSTQVNFHKPRILHLLSELRGQGTGLMRTLPLILNGGYQNSDDFVKPGQAVLDHVG